MSFALQMDFFEEPITTEDLLRAELKAVKLSADKVRKGTYAEINKLKKRVLELEERLDIIERHICQGNKETKTNDNPL